MGFEWLAGGGFVLGAFFILGKDFCLFVENLFHGKTINEMPNDTYAPTRIRVTLGGAADAIPHQPESNRQSNNNNTRQKSAP